MGWSLLTKRAVANAPVGAAPMFDATSGQRVHRRIGFDSLPSKHWLTSTNTGNRLLLPENAAGELLAERGHHFRCEAIDDSKLLATGP